MTKKRVFALMFAGLMVGGVGTAGAKHNDDHNPGPGPNGNNDHGLCTAYFNGQKNGHQQGSSPGPFGALEDAHDDDIQAIYEWCLAVVGPAENGPGGGDDGIGGNPEENGRFTDCFTDANNNPSDDCTDGDPPPAP